MFPKTHHFAEVLILCVEFWEMSHLTRDLSQGEKKITVVTSVFYIVSGDVVKFLN